MRSLDRVFGAAEVVSDRSWTFDLDADSLWGRMVDLDRYRQWWPWLRRFDADGGFDRGARWWCTVAPPLPYVVRFVIDLDRVDDRSVSATVTGDITGSATLDVEALDDARSRAHLVSRLAPANPVLRSFARAAGPLVRWGHDWVIDQGRRQFDPRGDA